MNKLEERIEESSGKAYLARSYSNAYIGGAQFVIDLELPVKFSEYLTTNYFKVREGWILNYDHLNSKPRSTKQIYSEWIENIYGK